MKILSDPAGDALLTNAEVMHWLRDQKNGAKGSNDSDSDGDGSEGIPLPPNALLISDDLLEYFKTCPSANQSMESVSQLFNALKKYKLSDPELLMIANIRPEAYAHITPLIADIHNRFDYDTIMEILQVVNSTLEPRPNNDIDNENGDVEEQQQAGATDSNAQLEPAATGGEDGDNGQDDGEEGQVAIVKTENKQAGDDMAD